jgi:hypothetical protein
MKIIIISLFLTVCLFGLTGCKEKALTDENIKLKAQVAVLEQQLELCSNNLRESKKTPSGVQYDPNITNPNDNKTF